MNTQTNKKCHVSLQILTVEELLMEVMLTMFDTTQEVKRSINQYINDSINPTNQIDRLLDFSVRNYGNHECTTFHCLYELSHNYIPVQ